MKGRYQWLFDKYNITPEEANKLKDEHILKDESYKIYKDEEIYEDVFSALGWGHDRTEISKEAAELLLKGNALAINDGEYTHWIVIKESD